MTTFFKGLSLDPLPYVRTQTISLIFTLLRDKSEQEQNLLRLLVNKLVCFFFCIVIVLLHLAYAILMQGDTEKSICSRASYHLLQLLQTHPAMKAVVVREVISLVLKPPAATATLSDGLPKGTGKHVRFSDDKGSSKKSELKIASAKKINGNLHARYYSMITLNQVVLTPGDRDVARQLLDVYFEMFKEVLGEGKAEEGVEKSDTDDKQNDVKVDKAGRVIDGGRKKAKKAGAEVKGAAGFTEVEDVNAKLISATLTGVNRALPFAKVDATDAKSVIASSLFGGETESFFTVSGSTSTRSS